MIFGIITRDFFKKYPRHLNIQKYNLYAISINLSQIKLDSCNQQNSIVHKKNFGISIGKSSNKYSLISDNSLLKGYSLIAYPHFSSRLNFGIHNKYCLFKSSLCNAPSVSSGRYQSTQAGSSTEIPDKDEIPLDADDFDTMYVNGLQCTLKDVSESNLTEGFMEILQNTHNVTGLPWWATIILTTVLVKAVIFPLTVFQRKHSVRLENAQLEFGEISNVIKEEVKVATKKYGWTVDISKKKFNEKIKDEFEVLFSRHETHPVKPAAVVTSQLIIWLGMSSAIGNMCCVFPNNDPANQVLYTEMTTGGFLWLENLTVPDSYLILPHIFLLMNLYNIWMARHRITVLNTVQKFTLSGASLLSIGFFLWSIKLPAGLVIYWATSSGCGALLNTLFSFHPIRRKLGIPEIKTKEERQKDVEEWLAIRCRQKSKERDEIVESETKKKLSDT